MPRNRAVALVVHEGRLLVMHRKNSRDYYTFPGGGVEEDETNEQAAVREIYEETSIECEVGKLAYQLNYDNGDVHYYFLAKYVAGTPMVMPGTNEYKDNELGFNLFLPEWAPIDELSNFTLYPLEVRDRFVLDSKNGFSEEVINFDLVVPEQYRKPKNS